MIKPFKPKESPLKSLPSFEDQIKSMGLEDIASSCGIEVKSRTEEILSSFITGDTEMIKMKERVKKLAKKNIPILILGETGVGKELIAQALHGERQGKFVAVNCGGIPDSLLEGEFFGCVKGAFTGATSDRAGYFEEAKDGTLFLDEIGELPKLLQCKFLRVLQSQKVRRLGGGTEIPINCRIVAATNRTDEWLKNSENFRLDLYYRLKGNMINISPLRNRSHDAKLICSSLGIEMEKYPILGDAYPWPGNVRELLNIIEGEIKVFNEEEI